MPLSTTGDGRLGGVNHTVRRLAVPLGGGTRIERVAPDVWAGVVASLGALLAAYAVSQGHAQVALLATVGPIVGIAVLRRPDLALILWVGALLADGRVISHIRVGPLYVTEVVLALLLSAIAVPLLLARRSRGPLPRSSWVAGVLIVAGIAALALHGGFQGMGWLRNSALVYYSLFAVIASWFEPTETFHRRLFLSTVIGSTIGLVLVLTHHAGSPELATSTGALRVAHGSFALPFGIAPLAILAAVRQNLLARRFLLLIPPLFLGLILINHRSAWVGFAVAATLLIIVTRVTVPVLLTALALGCVLTFILTGTHSRTSSVGEEIARARTVTSTTDPNARFRLQFWQSLVGHSLKSPIVGAGFGPYPAELRPAAVRSDPTVDPHSSWAALAFRVGPLAAALSLFLVLSMVAQGFSLGRQSSGTSVGAIVLLSAIVTYVAIFSAFNVVLELPYSAALFWLALGFLGRALRDEMTAPTRAVQVAKT